MPLYPFICDNCMYEEEHTVSMEEYDEIKDSTKCPDCGELMRRNWDGSGCAPAVKTEFRMEDYWKKHGIPDPEDPEHTRRANERIKMMRKKAKKRKERELEQLGDKAKQRRMRIKPDKRSVDELPDSHKGRVTLDKPKKESDD